MAYKREDFYQLAPQRNCPSSVIKKNFITYKNSKLLTFLTLWNAGQPAALRIESANSSPWKVANLEFSSFLWLLSCLGDFHKQIGRLSKVSLGSFVAFKEFSHSVTVAAVNGSTIMLIARGASLNAYLKRNLIIGSLSHPIDRESSFVIYCVTQWGELKTLFLIAWIVNHWHENFGSEYRKNKSKINPKWQQVRFLWRFKLTYS